MDRPDNRKTITIKINGKDRPFNEKDGAEKESAQNPIIKEDIEKKEKTELFASIQTAAGKEADDSFDWILPEETEEPDIKEYKIAPPKKTKKLDLSSLSKNFKEKNRNGLITSVFFAVFFAVLLGTSFGFIMLKLVITEEAVETNQPVTSEKPVVEEKPAAGGEKFALQPLSTFVVQGGVFSNKDAAKQIQDANIKKGAPAQLVEIDGQTFLYLGVADSIEHAKEIGTQLKDDGIDVFAKEITLEGKSLEGLQSEEIKFLEAVPSIYETLAASAASAAADKKISGTVLESIEKEKAILKEIKAEKLKHKGVIALKEDLDNAIKQADAYKESPDSATLTKLQQNLLGFLAEYQSL